MKQKQQFAACIYVLENQGCNWFAKGDKKMCEELVERMAVLLNTTPTTQQEIENDDAEESPDGRPLVLRFDDELVIKSALTTIRAAHANSYSADNKIQVSYEDNDCDDEETSFGFQPTGDTSFKVGDEAIFTVFHPNNPGGWTMVDVDLTQAEYWQLG